MTTSEPLPPNDWRQTELERLTSLQAGFPAKTLALQEDVQECPATQEADFGQKSSDWLAKYDRDTSSWKTSQTCLLALLANPGDGSGVFSETWPSAGMMRNGKTFQRRPWALPIADSASGLLPTPRRSGQSRAWKAYCRKEPNGNLEEVLGEMGFSGAITQQFVMWMMGFPEDWADISPAETQ